VGALQRVADDELVAIHEQVLEHDAHFAEGGTDRAALERLAAADLPAPAWQVDDDVLGDDVVEAVGIAGLENGEVAAGCPRSPVDQVLSFASRARERSVASPNPATRPNLVRGGRTIAPLDRTAVPRLP